LRIKIHNAMDASDAASVRAYAAKTRDPEVKQQADMLASEIDRLYAPRPLGNMLEANARALSAAPWVQKMLREARSAYAARAGAVDRYTITAKLLADLRDALPKISSPAARLRLLDLSLAVEAENFRMAAAVRKGLAKAPRRSWATLLGAASQAAYGTGMINAREHAELRRPFAALAVEQTALAEYLGALRYLELVPSWGTQSLRFEF